MRRATLYLAADGKQGLVFLDQGGKVGKTRMALVVGQDGSPSLSFRDKEEKLIFAVP